MKIKQNKRPGFSRWTRAAGMLGAGGAAFFIGGLALAMPETALHASLRGVAVWWDVLFPALFPFFVLSELLLGFGIVHMTGTLLDPLMRPLFRLPGVGGFVVAMGFASGYPVGARLTSRLMEQGLLNGRQGERLVFMTTTSDPIFLIGAVCIGFFGSSEAAPVLAIAHYGGALTLGILTGFLDRSAVMSSEDDAAAGRGRLRAALAAMHRARTADGRPFGLMLQQSVQSSLALMMIVGGLVVFFSAALDLFVNSGSLSFVNQLTSGMLHVFGLPPDMGPSLVKGIFEVTLGAKAAASAAASGMPLPMVDRIAAAAFVLSWAGLSVHAQVAGLMSRTRWRYAPFALFRLLHGAIAMFIVYLIWPLFF
ncbi:nucleoside recognition domain-containing protein [Cohnella kolymensis]|uniref:nucleoside recognition domain-containing protein n=1 Tax=Cohnella kolymensis TaxID=1590652 RepID=UPI000AE82CD2|nr:nucleoside recognition domain-containing protein [Cohnella kolymensis]